jgi:hypothetical protein
MKMGMNLLSVVCRPQVHKNSLIYRNSHFLQNTQSESRNPDPLFLASDPELYRYLMKTDPQSYYQDIIF